MGDDGLWQGKGVGCKRARICVNCDNIRAVASTHVYSYAGVKFIYKHKCIMHIRYSIARSYNPM